MDYSDPRIERLDVKRLLLRLFEAIASLSCFVLVLLCILCNTMLIGSQFFFIKHTPSTPTETVESFSVRNLNLSAPAAADGYAIADWNFTISITNQNRFGFSYDFKSAMHDNASNQILSTMFGPILSQGPQSNATVAVAFPSVWTPFSHRWTLQGGNLEIREISVGLLLEGKFEAIPEKSFPRLLHWFLNPLRLKCDELTVGIWSNSTGAAANVKVYYDRVAHHSFASWFHHG